MKYFIWTALVFFVMGCPSPQTSSPQNKKESGLQIRYNQKKDTLSIRVKNRPFLEVVQAFQKIVKYEIHYVAGELQKKVTFEIPPKRPYEFLKAISLQGGFTLSRSKAGLGFVLRSPWKVPSFTREQLTQKIIFATELPQVDRFFKFNTGTRFKSLGGSRQDREKTADIYYAYRPIFQNYLWEKVGALKKIQYHIPYKLGREEIDRIRTFYDGKTKEVFCEILFPATLKGKVYLISLIFQYSFYSRYLNQITMFVRSASPKLGEK